MLDLNRLIPVRDAIAPGPAETAVSVFLVLLKFIIPVVIAAVIAVAIVALVRKFQQAKSAGGTPASAAGKPENGDMDRNDEKRDP